MGSKRGGGSGRSLSLKTNNKLRRQQMYVEDKRAATKSRHEERHRRKKEEDKDPELRKERLARNQTMTIEKKRVWDEDADEDTLGAVVDLAQAKRRRLEEAAAELHRLEQGAEAAETADDDEDSMLGSDDEESDEDEEDRDDSERAKRIRSSRAQRDASLAPSVAASVAPSTTSTNMDLTPASLARKFPNLFSDDPLPTPKILVTTSINATIHQEAQDIATLFPNSQYIPRSAHRYGHKYSVREICKFAKNREFTAVVVINEDQKKPDRMTIVHLPDGPTLTYTISHYMPGKKIPGHGNPTNHYVSNQHSPLSLCKERQPTNTNLPAQNSPSSSSTTSAPASVS